MKCSTKLVALFLAGLILQVSIGERTAAAEIEELVTIEGITPLQLDNGLQILLYPDNSSPTVTINLTVFVGSRHEGYGETGMAHLLEHMVFKGTPTHGDIPGLLTEKGARFNGTTSLDRTNYYETLPAGNENLEFAIKLEADRMINSYIKGSDLQSEFSVVRNEFERGENSPSRILMQRMTSAAFDWHNYGKSTIGNKSDIELVPLPNLRAFYRKYYQPDNALLIIAGQFDKAKALEFTKQHFGAIPAPTRTLDKTYTIEPPQDGERSVKLQRTGEVAIAGLVYHVPASAHEDFAAVDVLSYILSTEPAGRLYKALVETKIASSIVGGTFAQRDPGIMIFYSQAAEKENVEEVQSTMIAEIDKIAESGVSDEEVQRVVQQIKKQREQSLNNTSRVAVQLSNWAAQGDWRLFFLYRDRVEKVTAADVQRVAKLYMGANNRTTGLFIPTEAPQYVTIPSTPDIAAMVKDYQGRKSIAQGEQFETTLDNIDKRTTRDETPSGIRTALLAKKSRGEQVVLSLSLNYGNAESLLKYDSAASFLGSMMMRGTESMNHQQIQDALDQLSASLSFGGSAGSLTISITAKRETLPAVLAIMTQVLQTPSFPEDEFEVLRQQSITSLEASKADPQALAMSLLARTMTPYDKNDIRASHTVEEQIVRLNSIKLDDIKELYATQIGNGSGELIVVGDFAAAELLPAVTNAVAKLATKVEYVRIDSSAFPDVKGRHESILTPGKKNAFYIAAHQVPVGRMNKDYAALIVANQILGGGSLSSRLADRVRQKDGLSYGVASMYRTYAFKDLGRFMMYAISNPANSDKVVAAIREEVDLLRKDGITAAELKKAKEAIMQSNAVSRATDSGMLGLLNSLVVQQRDIQTTKDLEIAIQALSVEQVNAAARKYMLPEKLIVITAGDFQAK